MEAGRTWRGSGELLLAGPVDSDKNPGPVSSARYPGDGLVWETLQLEVAEPAWDNRAGRCCGRTVVGERSSPAIYGEPMIFPMASDPSAPSYNLKSAMAPEK